MVSCRYAKIQDVITQENICKHFTVKFSTLSNKKASDKSSKSVRDVFEADVVCYEKTISTSFTIITEKKALDVDVDAKRDGPASVLNLFCYQKNIRKAHEKKSE